MDARGKIHSLHAEPRPAVEQQFGIRSLVRMVLALVADMHLRACALCVPGASVRFPAVCVLYSSQKRLKFPPAPSVPYGASVHLPFTSHMSVSASSLLYSLRPYALLTLSHVPGGCAEPKASRTAASPNPEARGVIASSKVTPSSTPYVNY